MATRAQVEAKIAGITDGGNNTAAEVRAVLTDLLNYTENNLEGFEIAPDTIIDTKTSRYFYSFKGVKNYSCSLYFIFHKVREGEGNQIKIELTEEEYNLLSGFIPLYMYSGKEKRYDLLVFKVPIVVFEKIDETPFTIALTIETDKIKRYFVVIGLSLNDNNAFVSTSIALNYKENTIINDMYLNTKNKKDATRVANEGENILDAFIKK
ncbi:MULTISPECIES: hypothetical protein [Chryseobacterium]|uniref:hypothetical protein n=1 Tax=Chryseobacterium TaxID=59732 RepID=UPI0012948A86|nr:MULTISPECIES: hypothetical protein [Chryseobacterium]MDR6920354.1 hypothetical protein [Chryseobacterium sp. 2987]